MRDVKIVSVVRPAFDWDFGTVVGLTNGECIELRALAATYKFQISLYGTMPSISLEVAQLIVTYFEARTDESDLTLIAYLKMMLEKEKRTVAYF